MNNQQDQQNQQTQVKPQNVPTAENAQKQPVQTQEYKPEENTNEQTPVPPTARNSMPTEETTPTEASQLVPAKRVDAAMKNPSLVDAVTKAANGDADAQAYLDRNSINPDLVKRWVTA